MKPIALFAGFLVLGFAAAVIAADSGQNALSDADLLKMAGNRYANGELPLGDGHYVLDAPRKGYIYLCHTVGGDRGGAQVAGGWIHGTTWNWREKLSVQGHVMWDQAQFSATVSGDARALSGNGLPRHATGIFPIQPNDPAYAYDRNPNSILANVISENLPIHPIYTDPPFCMGMEVGTMLDGVPLFNGFDAGMRDAAAHEVQDSCQGHPQITGSYHYHSLSSCIENVNEKTVIGYALDGFPITGPLVAPGKYLTTDDLDVCHGLTSEIIEDGRKKMTYHYVMTMDFPYSVSCFRAKPVRTGPPHQEHAGQAPQGPDFAQGPPRPPAEAINACSNRADGDACGFVSPRGDTISGTCHAPGQHPLACIPARLR